MGRAGLEGLEINKESSCRRPSTPPRRRSRRPARSSRCSHLTDSAIEKVKYFAKSMPDSEGKPLRVFVQGGGCSGFQYGFTVRRKERGRQRASSRAAITVVVDPQSATYLKDATVNYIEDFRGAGFSVENPNSTRRLRLRQELQRVEPRVKRERFESPAKAGLFRFGRSSDPHPCRPLASRDAAFGRGRRGSEARGDPSRTPAPPRGRGNRALNSLSPLGERGRVRG